MKLALLPLLLFVLFSCSVNKKSECNYITDYYQTIYKADYEFETGNYQKAFDLYQSAFNSCEPITTLGYNEIANFAETTSVLKKYDLTFEYLKKSILEGSKLSRFQNNTNFEEFMVSKYGKQLEEEYDTLHSQFMDNIDLKLRNELILMRYADQGVRSKGSEADWTKVDSIDKLHEKRLIELFENQGFPNDDMVGPPSLDGRQIDIGPLLLHTADSIRLNYFVPKVREFVRKGKASPHYIGIMIDQYYLYNKEPQIYGTYTTQSGGYATMIKDLKKVDSNRISIGLAPLELKQKKDSLIKIKYGF
ncbi:hypothetical protein [Aequorivita capsosiphonis]|uniref:hypothetical protein n=1 Tax=Aequorivita capsosiphonis TaxID=487317 RepID=UPI0004106401|nr:hypothetical protein [Aequorivita capsosiphonis]